MFEFLAEAVARTVSTLATWAWWIGEENGPAVGKQSKATWRGLVWLGRVQFWLAMVVLVGLFLWLLVPWTFS